MLKMHGYVYSIHMYTDIYVYRYMYMHVYVYIFKHTHIGIISKFTSRLNQ